MQSLILGLIVGLIYLRLDDNQKSIQNKSGAVFFILINQSFSGVFGVLMVSLVLPSPMLGLLTDSSCSVCADLPSGAAHLPPRVQLKHVYVLALDSLPCRIVRTWV